MNNRSSHQRCSVKKGVLINFTKFTGKYLCQSVFLILLKKKLWHRCFPINFAKFLNTFFGKQFWMTAAGISKNALSSTHLYMNCLSLGVQ